MHCALACSGGIMSNVHGSFYCPTMMLDQSHHIIHSRPNGTMYVQQFYDDVVE